MTEKINNIGFIGAGKMANAILSGIIKSGFIGKENIFIYDKNIEASQKTKGLLSVNISASYEELLKKCEAVLIATKPFVIDEVLDNIKEFAGGKLIISILAGVSTKKIEEKLVSSRVIRVMPNTPALVGAGMSAVCRGESSNEGDRDYVLNIFSNLGEAIKTDEKYIDIITAISGSGPAYYYYFIEMMARAGEKLGLDYETSLKLSSQTAVGAGLMVQKSEENVSKLIQNVTTPGGCTEVGNNILNASDVEDVIFRTIKDTRDKAKSLG